MERTDSINRKNKIPKAFSWDELQVDAEDIATPEKIAKWEYLDKILHEISQSLMWKLVC